MKSLSRVVCVLAALSLLPISAFAQSDGPMWSRMNRVKVKPEYVAEFIELQKEISAWSKKNGTPWRRAWRVASFGNSYTFAFFTGISSFAQIDEPGNLDPTIAAKFTKYVADRDSFASVYENELSKPLPDGTAPKLAIVTTYTVAPGRNAEFRDHIKNDVAPYMSDPATGLKGYDVSRTIFGGPTTWTIVAHIDKYAYIDGGSMASRTLDEAQRAALQKKQAGLVTHVERIIATYIPELSFYTGSTSSNEP